MPGTGAQVHDFNGGIAPSGLFWTVRIPDDALTVNGHTARLSVRNLRVVDSFVFLGSTEIPATVSFDITFRATGKVLHYRPGSSDPTDPSNFAGEFREANATGRFAGEEAGFRFTAFGSSDGVWAEMGHERNGVFLRGPHDDLLAGLEGGATDESQAVRAAGDMPSRALPNPAIARTNVEFSLPTAGPVWMEVYDPAGRRIARVLDGQMLPGGRHSVMWNLRDAEDRRVTPGLYLVRWVAGPESGTVRVAVLP